MYRSCGLLDGTRNCVLWRARAFAPMAVWVLEREVCVHRHGSELSPCRSSKCAHKNQFIFCNFSNSKSKMTPNDSKLLISNNMVVTLPHPP